MNAPERPAARTTQDMTDQGVAAQTATDQTATDQTAEAGRFFRYMADYVGFTPADAAVIRQTRPLIAKYLPEIVSDFYTHLLRYPLTRRLFLLPDGTINEPYLVLRMRHLSNFWLRTAEGVYDDAYAAYVDAVGRAHTSRGADPAIYVPERYVIGQVGMIQHAISRALSHELRVQDDELEFRAVEAWDKLMMVLLEMLSRAYGHEQEPEPYGAPVPVDVAWVRSMAHQAIELEHGDDSAHPQRRVAVATAGEIPQGQRKIVQVDGLSIGVFHHQGAWVAIRNSCVHQGGPVATGVLEGDVLTCPWHGYRYDLCSGRCLTEPDAELDRYAVTVVDDTVYVDVPDSKPLPGAQTQAKEPALQENEFRVADLAAGKTLTLSVNGQTILVYNVDGRFYATDESCTHAQGPLSVGKLEGSIITCLLHGSCFDVTTGAVVCAPATEPLKTYPVTIEGEVGRVTMPERLA
ncbi:MAG TPA: Rieske 2Fe-2S domain-containing protein [Caldilineaceae bacterium]|nr:Rieske 2Fe-2S domain-containing protein [Caldilineaceae bacterium]